MFDLDFLCGVEFLIKGTYKKRSQNFASGPHNDDLRIGLCTPSMPTTGTDGEFLVQLTPTLFKALMVHQVWAQYGILAFQVPSRA